MCFQIASSVNLDEMPHPVASHLILHYLQVFRHQQLADLGLHCIQKGLLKWKNVIHVYTLPCTYCRFETFREGLFSRTSWLQSFTNIKPREIAMSVTDVGK